MSAARATAPSCRAPSHPHGSRCVPGTYRRADGSTRYIYIYMYIHVYIYTHIYQQRERLRRLAEPHLIPKDHVASQVPRHGYTRVTGYGFT